MKPLDRAIYHPARVKPPEGREASKRLLVAGCGCTKHPNCFECTLDDCRMPSVELNNFKHEWWFTNGIDYSRKPI